MDDVSLLVVPTLVIFAIGMAVVLRQIVNTAGERYQYKEYRLDQEADKQDGRRQNGTRGNGGSAGGPASRN